MFVDAILAILSWLSCWNDNVTWFKNVGLLQRVNHDCWGLVMFFVDRMAMKHCQQSRCWRTNELEWAKWAYVNPRYEQLSVLWSKLRCLGWFGKLFHFRLCKCNNFQLHIITFFSNMITLQGTNISPPNATFEDDFPFPKVGYVSSLERINYNDTLRYFHPRRQDSPGGKSSPRHFQLGLIEWKPGFFHAGKPRQFRSWNPHQVIIFSRILFNIYIHNKHPSRN